MPIPEFTLRDFNRVASGEYNAGQIDFATGDNGRVTLAKINNHVHKRGLNKTTLSAERILEVKESFVSALRRGGVSDADIAAIRTRLGIPAEMKATSTREAQEDILRKRFVPLSRNAVREILDEYANNGRGFGEGKVQLSWDELHAAHETAHRSRSAVRKSERTNAESLANNRTKIDFTFTHALAAADRRVNVDEDILRFQAIVSNHADYATREERGRILDMARSQLDALLRSCGAAPSDDRPATASIKLRDGQTIELSAGMGEKKFAELLRDLILRFSADPDGPGAENANELEVAAGLLRLNADEREALWGSLADDPRGGFKARAIAI